MCDRCGHGKAGAQHPQVIPSPGVPGAAVGTAALVSQNQLGNNQWCQWMDGSLIAVADFLSPLLSGRAGFATIPSVCAGT